MLNKWIFYLAALAAQFHKFSRWLLVTSCMAAINAIRYPLLQVGFSFGGLITLIQRLYQEHKLYLLTFMLAAIHSLMTSLTWFFGYSADDIYPCDSLVIHHYFFPKTNSLDWDSWGYGSWPRFSYVPLGTGMWYNCLHPKQVFSLYIEGKNTEGSFHRWEILGITLFVLLSCIYSYFLGEMN